MLVRQVVIPTSPEQLWDALTEPAGVAAWFGSQVEWDLRPGGTARFLENDGTVRDGVVEAVLPGRHLSFRWWPEHQGEGATSRVNYHLEPAEDGTCLTVTEEPVPAAPDVPAALGAPTACATAGRPTACPTAGWTAVRTAVGQEQSWSDWDSRLFRCWALAVAPDPAVASAPARSAAAPAGRAVTPAGWPLAGPAGR